MEIKNFTEKELLQLCIDNLREIGLLDEELKDLREKEMRQQIMKECIDMLQELASRKECVLH